MDLKRFTSRFSGLWTVPSIVATGLALIALLCIWIDLAFDPLGDIVPGGFIGYSGAQIFLTTLAGGAMTALSLAYSLVLVVFTLAAANIGPRLLKRFATDRVNQFTAGILGGTFLFAMVAIFSVTEDFVPQVTIMVACLLTALIVFQLIYFVRQTSRNITIDDEIAEIAKRLTAALKDRFETADSEDEESELGEFEHALKTEQAGYVSEIDEDSIVALAERNSCIIRLEKPADSFVLAGEEILSSTTKLPNEAAEDLLEAVQIASSRSSGNEIEFSTNLLVEIALRALSPGVNDTFTALACVDSISNAFAEVADKQISPSIRRGEDGQPRVVIPNLSPDRLFSQAFDPIRRASRNNILMAQGLARAYTRLFTIGSEEIRSQCKRHARLLLEEIDQGKILKTDRDSVVLQLTEDLLADA